MKKQISILLLSILLTVTRGYSENCVHYNTCRLFLKISNHNDSADVFSAQLKSQFDSMITRNRLNWKNCDPQINSRINSYLRAYQKDDNENLDSLPYSVWDLCESQKIDYLVVTYIFYDNDQIISSTVSSYLFPLHGRAFESELSDENIEYYYNVFRIKDNRSVLSYAEDIDDLLEFNADRSPVGAAKRFISKVEKKYLKIP